MLKAKAQALGVSANRFVTDVLEKTLAPDLAPAGSAPFETGYGMWAKYGPAPSAEEIDENRREMFRSFAQGRDSTGLSIKPSGVSSISRPPKIGGESPAIHRSGFS